MGAGARTLFVAVVAFFAGMFVEYAATRTRVQQVVANKPEVAATPADRRAGNGFAGMEFGSVAHAPMIVRHVVTGGPADRVGIKAGDHVVGFGSVMNPTVSHAIKIIEASHPGDTLNVIVNRGGAELGVTIRLIDHTEYSRLKDLERTRILQTKRE